MFTRTAAAESDLTQAILDGLGNAENFLLLASPASSQSRWVAEEVRWWLENRDRRSFFVLLTDGEAVWDNGVLDQERTTALRRPARRSTASRRAGSPSKSSGTGRVTPTAARPAPR